MTILRRINYSDNKKITAIKSQAEFLWVAFDKNAEDECLIEKQFALEPSQTFFTVTREVTKVVKMDADNDNLYVAYEDTTLLGEIFSLTNPLTTSTEIAIPSGLDESPVDIFVDNTDVYFLLPGNISGVNAKILRYNTDGDFQEEIDLSRSDLTIYNASSMVIDSIGDIYIVTYTDPATVVRVISLSGGGWDFEQTIII